MTPHLDDARGYASAGRIVFPTGPDKTPLTPHGFKDATTDEAAIRAWWARYPDAGIGIPTGAITGFIVLDVDPRHGGQDSLNALLTDYGPLPGGPHSKTGGGGDHYFFAHPGGTIGNATNIRPGLDLRADGGYIVAPPSGHPSGGTYQWIVPLDSAPLLPPPDWLLDFINRRREGTAVAVPQTQLTADQKIPHGQHHDSIVSTSAALAKRMAGVSFDTLLRAVRAAMSELLDDIDRHENEIADACRSAILKFGRPAPPPPPEAPHAAPDHVVPTAAPTTAPGPAYDHLWQHDKDGNITAPDRFAFETTMMAESRFIAPGDTEELLRFDSGAYEPGATWVKKWCQARHAEQGITASLHFVAECIGGITRSSYVDRDTINPPGYYCLTNGLLHFDNGTFQFGPHTPDIHVTTRLPVAYDPDATCPRFLTALAEMLPNEQTRNLIREEWGYTFIPGNPYKRAFFWVGAKNTGKSALLEILKGIIDLRNISAVSLHEFSDQRFAKADLYGKLLNVHADLSPRSLKDVGTFKMLLGRDIIRAEKKFLPPFEFVNSTKMYYSANEMPPVPDDEAFFERWIVTEFTVVIPPDRRNPHFADEIVAAEAPGILNWMLAGATNLFARGYFDDGGDAAATAKAWRRLSNSLVWFVEVAVVRDLTARTPKADLYAAYAQFCADNGLEAKPDRVVGAVLRTAFPGIKDGPSRMSGRGSPIQKVWYGIRVASEARENGAPGTAASEPETDLRHSWRRPIEGQDGDTVGPSALPSQSLACQDVTTTEGPSEGSGATGATATAGSLVVLEKRGIIQDMQDKVVVERGYSGGVARVAPEPNPKDRGETVGPGGVVGGGSETALQPGPDSGVGNDASKWAEWPIEGHSRLARKSNPEERSGEVRKRHPNCPDCVELRHHVCYVCHACVWWDNHAEEHGLAPPKEG